MSGEESFRPSGEVAPSGSAAEVSQTSSGWELIEGVAERMSALEDEADLLVEMNYCGRAGALDRLEFGVLDPISRLRKMEMTPVRPSPSLGAGFSDSLDTLEGRAETIRDRFATIDASFLSGLRQRIRGGLRGAPLRAILDGQAAGRHHLANSPGYDALDGLLADLLFPAPGPTAALEREPEMVFYQPTPARIILDLVDRIVFSRDDLFVDIGSGLGLVPILVNLLTGVRSTGIEIDPAYQRYASSRAADLLLADVGFITADARAADYSKGTVFFLYTPFSGTMLRTVLDRIDSQREGRGITLFSFGPCTGDVAAQTWLQPIGPVDDDHSLAMFRAR